VLEVGCSFPVLPGRGARCPFSVHRVGRLPSLYEGYGLPVIGLISLAAPQRSPAINSSLREIRPPEARL